MDLLHIEDFYKDAASILLLLYKRFPTKSPLYIEDICGPDTPDDFGLHSPRYTACFNASLWLAEEGYFRYSQLMQQDILEDAVLSQKAFIFLSTPRVEAFSDAQAGGETNALIQSRVQHLAHVMKNESSEKLNALTLNYLTAFE